MTHGRGHRDDQNHQENHNALVLLLAALVQLATEVLKHVPWPGR